MAMVEEERCAEQQGVGQNFCSREELFVIQALTATEIATNNSKS